jgi:hypothetical protein
LIEEKGSAWIFADHVALRAALAGRLYDAARLAGYSDYAWAAREATRQPNEVRARARLQTIRTNSSASSPKARS